MPPLFCAALLSLAQAHPISAELTAHQLRLTLEKTHATVDYQVWIPNRHLIEQNDSTQSSITQDRLQDVASGLSLYIDEVSIPLQAMALESSPITTGGRVTGFQVAFQAALPADRNIHHLLLVNAVEPDEIAQFNTEVFVHPSLRVLNSSLLDMDQGHLSVTRHGQWRMDENSRELEVEFRALPRVLQLPGRKRFRPIHRALGAPWLSMGILGLGALSLVFGTVRMLRHRRTQ